MAYTNVVIWAIWLCWSALFLTPNALKNLDQLKIFHTPRRIKETFLRTNLHFAPGLLHAMQSKSPPSMDFFKDLPLPLVPCWAVYLLVLEKEHCLPKIYIGSATHLRRGALHRLHQYNARDALPLFVAQALDDGYNISHIGFLCWADIPSFAAQVPTRALFLILETVFSLLLWPMVSRTKHYFMPRLCPWPVSDLRYGGLCTHFSINEGIVGIDEHDDEDLSAEQIEALEELNHNRRLERQRASASK